MPRVNASARPVVSRTAARPRAKKMAVPQDRLTARRLFWRRVKRSLKPGLWFMGVFAVLVIGSELFRSFSAVTPVRASAPVVVRHRGWGLAELAADAGLRISKVEIVGAQMTDKALLRQAIGEQPGDPSFGFSLSAVQQRVEQLGPVQSATVQRELPGTLIVTIAERDAYAIWQTGGNGTPAKFVLIDKAGNVIADQDAAAAKRRDPGMLLLVGADAPQNAQTLITQLQAEPIVRAHVTAAEHVDGLRWNLILKDQTLVKLPVTNEQGAIAQLAALQSSMQLLDRPVEVIDLRQAGRLVVRPYPAAVAAPNKDKHK